MDYEKVAISDGLICISSGARETAASNAGGARSKLKASSNNGE